MDSGYKPVQHLAAWGGLWGCQEHPAPTSDLSGDHLPAALLQTEGLRQCPGPPPHVQSPARAPLGRRVCRHELDTGRMRGLARTLVSWPQFQNQFTFSVFLSADASFSLGRASMAGTALCPRRTQHQQVALRPRVRWVLGVRAEECGPPGVQPVTAVAAARALRVDSATQCVCLCPAPRR